MTAREGEWSMDAEATDGAHTIGRWLTDRAATTPARTAIDDRGVRIGYGDLEARAVRLARALRGAGYGPGDRIATVSGNSIDHVVAFFACASAFDDREAGALAPARPGDRARGGGGS